MKGGVMGSAQRALTGISVITCTNRPHFLEHMARNYARQSWPVKEWIIVVNKDKVDMSRYQRVARRIGNVRVFHFPAKVTLGYCLNFAAARAKYPVISKMDDDEYYGTPYLADMMRSFARSKADIVGKRAIFIHLKGSRVLVQRFYAQNQFVAGVAGGTITFKRYVWNRVKFRDHSLGEDVRFCGDCRRSGFRLYAGDKYNFCALRRKDPSSHTWKLSDREFLAHPLTKVIARNTDNYRKYVDRK